MSAPSPKINPLNPTIPDHGELDMRQKRLRRFQNDGTSDGSDASLSMGQITFTKNNKGKGKAKAGGMNGLSVKEQRTMSGTPDPVFNPVSRSTVCAWRTISNEALLSGRDRLGRSNHRRHFATARKALSSTNISKYNYFRKTSNSTSRMQRELTMCSQAPDPKTVRPLPILRQTLEHLKRKWRTESNYAWVCDQFKSMRQDLTVQRIKNDFTVMTYEIHARIALEKGDLGEYNQCQSQLRELYKHGLEGHPMEFLAYRILYLVHTRNRSGESRLRRNHREPHLLRPCWRAI